MKEKRIIIPTDFTVQSLGIVVDVVEQYPAEQVEVILVYGRYQSTSISEIFAHSKDELLDDLQSEEFIAACEMIRNRFKTKLKELYADIMTSDNQNYVKNYVRGLGAQGIIIPSEYGFDLTEKRAFDVRGCLEAINSPKTTTVNYAPKVSGAEGKDDLVSLFFRRRFHVTV